MKCYQFKITLEDGQVFHQYVTATTQAEAFASAAIRQANLNPGAVVTSIVFVG